METNTTPKRPDYTGGDHSFKNWFKIMWQNHFIQLFVLFFTLVILQLINFSWCVETWYDCHSDGIIGTIAVSIGMAIPFSGASIIAYKAFFQYWRDLKSGNSR
jgi:hypothetical protein